MVEIHEGSFINPFTRFTVLLRFKCKRRWWGSCAAYFFDVTTGQMSAGGLDHPYFHCFSMEPSLIPVEGRRYLGVWVEREGTGFWYVLREQVESDYRNYLTGPYSFKTLSSDYEKSLQPFVSLF